MTTQLLNALTCEPNDTLAWLALADALEEAGEVERAELTRLRTNPENQKRVQELLLSGVKPCVPTLTNSIGMELALIPSGKFMMGSPGSEECRFTDEEQREVEITKPFWMGVYPVTQEEYQVVMGINPSKFKGERLPVDRVNWDDAVEFCKRLSEVGERVYRLPTEAEWEYACRAGTTTRFNLGDDKAMLREAGWYEFNTSIMQLVGGKKPNAWGLYDMHGNVWEMCSNIFVESDWVHAVRGGGCSSHATQCRSAARFYCERNRKRYYFGFRVVSTVG